MRNDTMGIILTSDDKIPPITDIRANSALPIAGRYRIIDFVLSNMANAGITNIGVATASNYSSLMDHIKSGKPWEDGRLLDKRKYRYACRNKGIYPPQQADICCAFSGKQYIQYGFIGSG